MDTESKNKVRTKILMCHAQHFFLFLHQQSFHINTFVSQQMNQGMLLKCTNHNQPLMAGCLNQVRGQKCGNVFEF